MTKIPSSHLSSSSPTDLVLPESFLSRAGKFSLYASLSGGADSTALVLALAQHRISFRAVHFTHGIRSAVCGDAERAFCESFCREHGIELLTVDLAVPEHRQAGEGLEEAARRCRLEAWRKILSNDSAESAVVTAHHADDAAETLLLRLFRGGNVSSLAGLREESVVGGLRFLRPLLSFTKAQLTDYLHANGVHNWMEDATNGTCEYSRNFFRNRILPEIAEKIPFAQGGLRQAAAVLRQDAVFIEAMAAQSFQSGDPADPDFWKSAPEALRIRMLRLFLSKETKQDVIPDQAFFLRFNEFLRNCRSGTRLAIPDTDFFLLCYRGRLSVAKAEPSPSPVIWDYRKENMLVFGKYRLIAETSTVKPDSADANTAFFDADKLPETLSVTIRQNGDRMIPFGSAGEQKVKKLLTDAHISPLDRDTLPVIRAGETIAWIPGVRRSSLAPVTPETKEILILTCRVNSL